MRGRISPSVFATCLLLVSFVACNRLTYIPPSTAVTGIDFTPYTAQGFMFTPEMYRGDYESVGVINVAMQAEGKLVRKDRSGTSEWEFSELKIDDVVREAHKRAVAMGANAVVNFTVKASPRTVGTVSVPGIEVTGFAIKRTGAFR
jgi:uncharacterized protein YbjQ (UPF0145 family)